MAEVLPYASAHAVGVEAIFLATGTQRMDLITDDAETFYRSFAHREKPGFRIYPGS